MKKSAVCILALFLIAAVAASAALGYCLRPMSDENYTQSIETLSMMENTWQTAVPQTEIHDLLEAHFNSALPEGKTEKKAIVIGYDGCRADMFTLLDSSHDSAINTLLSDGGHAVFSYCGGVNYPEKNTQDTSTAPGWCSMLTGVTADKHGVYENYSPKEVEPKTLLISLVEDGKIDSSAFYVSWAGHFTKPKATYVNELTYIEQNNINSTFLRADNDEGTIKNVKSDLEKADCSDFIFLTLEFTDHSGHSTGFNPLNPEYVEGFYEADAAGADFINTIKSRPTYDKEDWLILITTDHGGKYRNHGGPSIEERITFIVSNQEIA